MVLGEIGEHGHTDRRAVQAALGEADRRGLDGAGDQTLVDKLPESLLQQHRVRGGQAIEAQVRRLAGTQRADHATAARCGLRQLRERLSQPPGGGGLAVGAGDGHHVKLAGRMIEPRGGDGTGGRLQAAVSSDARIIEPERLGTCQFDQAGCGALGQCGAHELAAIGHRTRPGNEAVVTPDLAAVHRQRAVNVRAQPVGGLLRAVQLQHQKLSSTDLATICGLTAMSGSRPWMRKVCCTTSLNTGAATSPPK